MALQGCLPVGPAGVGLADRQWRQGVAFKALGLSVTNYVTSGQGPSLCVPVSSQGAVQTGGPEVKGRHRRGQKLLLPAVVTGDAPTITALSCCQSSPNIVGSCSAVRPSQLTPLSPHNSPPAGRPPRPASETLPSTRARHRSTILEGRGPSLLAPSGRSGNHGCWLTVNKQDRLLPADVSAKDLE